MIRRICTGKPYRVSHSHVLRVRWYNIVPALQERGLVKTVTSPALDETASREPMALYCGVDPTASSLHVGNLLTLIPVLHFLIHGHTAVTLVGGATGQVGDPSGKSAERDKIAAEILQKNVTSLKSQLNVFFSNAQAYAVKQGHDRNVFGRMTVVNNADWYKDMPVLEFFTRVCRNVRLSSMLGRSSVRDRLSNDSMNLAEFNYQVFQAYDFWQLHKTHGVRLQIGGSDQYGNITAGLDLIARLQKQEAPEEWKKEEAYGLTVPLLTTPSGEKFGKSAGNAIWLDPGMTSPFDLYQYFLKTPDSHVEAYLRMFTLLSMQRIAEVVTKHNASPTKRIAARLLADHVLEMVHGSEALDRVMLANRILFPAEYRDLPPVTSKVIVQAFLQDPALRRRSRSEVLGERVTALLRDCGAVKSGKEAGQLILNGGVRCGQHVVQHVKEVIEPDWLLDDELLIVRIGKNKFTFVQLM